MLNKGEASKLVKTTFDIWKARFYHKKALLVPTLQKDWSKEGVSAIIADHGSFTAEPEIVTQMLLCVTMPLNYGQHWRCSVIIVPP